MPIESTGNSGSLPSGMSFNTGSSDIKKLLHASGVYDKYEMGMNKSFSRFPIIDPYNALYGTKEYIFITRPDLCLFNTYTKEISPAISNSSFFVDALNRYRDVALQLQSSASVGATPFIPLLTNSVTSSLSVPGLSASTIETAANAYGTKISYRSSSASSDIDFDFNLEFSDTKYLDVYMFFKMYDEYEKLKWAGGIDFSPSVCQDARWQTYTVNKILHDQFSAYKIVVADDGMRIVYYANIIGITTTSTPRDAFSDMTSVDGGQKLTVDFKGHFVRDMDPIIIRQFNTLAKQTSGFSSAEDLPLYDIDNHAMEGDWSLTPYIVSKDVTSKRGTYREYYLKWKKR